MKIRQSIRPDDYINVIPFIDVLLVLLIFFMVSSRFTHNAELRLSLPSASPKEIQQQMPQTIEVTISAGGAYAVNGRNVVDQKASTLSRAIAEMANGETDIPLILSADAQAAHQSVVTAMDVAGQLGFTKLSVTTRRNED